MNRQITFEDVGIIPRQEPLKAVKHIDYVSPCGGCVCDHCANNVDCTGNKSEELEFFCYNCDDCCYYNGYGRYNKKLECSKLKVTEEYAKSARKKFKVLKPESEG